MKNKRAFLWRKPSTAVGLAACALSIAVWGAVRLVIFSNAIMPLTYALPLLICLWTRSRRMLWAMAGIFLIMAGAKMFWIMPEFALPTFLEWATFFAQAINIAVAATVVFLVLDYRDAVEQRNVELARANQETQRQNQALEAANAELDQTNEELATREEDVNRQNEELAVLNEELERQAEELRSQADELSMQTQELEQRTADLEEKNKELLNREEMLRMLLGAAGPGGTEVDALRDLCQRGIAMMGNDVVGSAILERHESVVRVLSYVGESAHDGRPSEYALDYSLAGIVMSQNRPASLRDTSLRPDLIFPRPSEDAEFRSILACPLNVDGVPFGAIEFYALQVRDWTEDQFRLATWVAGQCSLAIEFLRLKSRLQESDRQQTMLLEAERAARSEAEKVNRLKDEFLATVSHELRTPLNTIMGWSRLLSSHKVGDSKRALEIIERGASTLNRLVEDLLDTNRIISGKIHLKPELTDLALLAHGTVRAVQPAADAKDVHVGISIDPAIGMVRCDPDRMQQILWNLLMNAVKFTPGRGRVMLDIRKDRSDVIISVADTGQGIPGDFLPHVFERFRQIDGSAARRHGGLGLGLAIVKNLVEMHGGNVVAESDGAGKGAKFTVSLPHAIGAFESFETGLAAQGTATDGSSPAGPRRACAGLKVVVVDDDEDTRVLVSRVLRDSGMEVHATDSAAAGLQLAMSVKPDLLVSDIGMPGEDGYQLVRRIRSDLEYGAALPCIALTALARPEDREKALASGYNLHIAKPFDPSLLPLILASHAHRAATVAREAQSGNS